MSLSEPPKMNVKNIEAFRFRPLEADESVSLPKSGNFVLQTFDGSAPGKVAYSEKELTIMAEQILAAAEEKRQHIEQEAYEEGFRQGQKDGQEVGRRGLEEVMQRFENMAAALAEEKEALYRQRERDLVELALLISRKIVGRELTIQPEAIGDLVALGFRNLFEAEQLKLLVHPQDYELLAHHPRDSWPAGLELVPDGAITPGGFRLATDRGEIDGTLETRWAKVHEAIDKVLENRHEDRAS
jgi:flagellar assembly protein FliH